MALRIEINQMWNGKLEMREGDLTGSTTISNVNKEDILKMVSLEIDNLIEKKRTQKECKR